MYLENCIQDKYPVDYDSYWQGKKKRQNCFGNLSFSEKK
jgi:hypothetical protein